MPHVVTLLLGLMLVFGGALRAQTSDVERARGAVLMLQEASAELAAAQAGGDRVQALTGAASAIEAGLVALRSGLPEITRRLEEVNQKLAAQNAETAQFLAMLMRLESAGSPVALLHPGGAAAAARGGMLMAGIVPVLNAKADDLRAAQAELRMLESLQADADDALRTGLAEVRAARDALGAAVAGRGPLPKRFVADPVREAILISSARTLDAFAENLDRIADGAMPAAPDPQVVAKGDWPLPVTGTIMGGYGEMDAAGNKREGIVVQTRSEAVVINPSAATLRYVGPLLDLGLVVILEPLTDVLVILAGLGTVFGETGDVIAQGDPVGLMSAVDEKSGPQTSIDGDRAGLELTETLYIEVREQKWPVDPTEWFRTKQNG